MTKSSSTLLAFGREIAQMASTLEKTLKTFTAFMRFFPVPASMVTAKDYTYIFANRLWFEFFAKTAEEVIGKRLEEVFANEPEKAATIKASNDRAKRDGEYIAEESFAVGDIVRQVLVYKFVFTADDDVYVGAFVLDPLRLHQLVEQ